MVLAAIQGLDRVHRAHLPAAGTSMVSGAIAISFLVGLELLLPGSAARRPIQPAAVASPMPRPILAGSCLLLCAVRDPCTRARLHSRDPALPARFCLHRWGVLHIQHHVLMLWICTDTGWHLNC